MRTNAKKNYFEGVETIDELKKMYHAYVKMYHPDLHKGEDTTGIMADINGQYDELFARVKDKHVKFDTQTNKYTTYTYATDEQASEFRDILNFVLKFKGCATELIGSWLWISGNTKEYKEQLNKLGFKFSGNKKAWSFHHGEYKKRSKTRYSMDDLRNKYSSMSFRNEELKELEA